MAEVLRLATAGSVDDGKSTLIGRLLYDSKAIFEDQLEALERTSRDRGDQHTDLALLTDGLRAEREQGITIDVAYRYFATPKRKLIIADTPGHLQYTRNMVTGASTADLALILVDARNGIVEQSRRHAYLSSLLGLPHVVVCINKMDLVGWSQDRFEEIKADFEAFAAGLELADVSFIPVSALHGDNVVDRSPNLAWHQGPALLEHLEAVELAHRDTGPVRFPVQYVIRPQRQSDPESHDYRGYAGQVAGGSLRPGDEVVVLPSGIRTSITHIDSAEGPVDEAFAPMSVTVRLAHGIDVSRGDMIVGAAAPPIVTQDVEAIVCWMSEVAPLRAGATLAVKHTTRWARARVAEVQHRVDIDTLHLDLGADQLALNEIGRVSLRTTQPLVHDEYRHNRTTGSFILVDEATHTTVGAGMIVGPSTTAP